MVKQTQELLKFRHLLIEEEEEEEEEAVCKDRIIEQFLRSTLLNDSFQIKGFSHNRYSKKTFSSLTLKSPN